MICATSGQNWPSGSGEEGENAKVYRQTDDEQCTGDQKNSRTLSSGELIKLIIQLLENKTNF
jgi:hypothetical protein